MTEDLYDELTGRQMPIATPGRVLTIGAHPDDAEFGAGATLARWAAAGSEVTMLIVTDGSKGSWDPDANQGSLILRRKDEQSRAADVLGATSVIHLDYVDGELENTMELRKALALHIRAARPDVLLTHDPWQRYQLHPDHRAAGIAAIDAIVAAREPLAHRDSGLPAHRPSSMLLWSADEPDHAEPVASQWFDLKIEALMCHSSQGATTMRGAQSGGDRRLAFIDRISLWHAENGERLKIGPSETFKKITP